RNVSKEWQLCLVERKRRLVQKRWRSKKEPDSKLFEQRLKVAVGKTTGLHRGFNIFYRYQVWSKNGNTRTDLKKLSGNDKGTQTNSIEDEIRERRGTIRIEPVTNPAVSPPKLRRTVNTDVPIEGLPTKNKAKKRKAVNAKDVVGNHCHVCHVTFYSKEDKQAGIKGKGSRVQNSSIGCIVDGCDHWVHVRCSSLKDVIVTKEDARVADFLCPKHKKDRELAASKLRVHSQVDQKHRLWLP
uniref:Zinc finger PHD-type domain-containing protein n=1 Tax=Clytia hemisphaerica TaxID=252671 RepID=A0A7M5V6B9_9CNID